MTAGYLPMSGQIVDATLMTTPRQRNSEPEKAAIKAGKRHPRSGRGAGEGAVERCRRPLDDEVLEGRAGH